MAIIKCPECGKKISSTVEKCQQCGCILTEEMKVKAFSDQQKQKNRRKKLIPVLSVALAVIIGISAILVIVKVKNVQEQKKIEELAKREYDEFYDNLSSYCSSVSDVYTNWLSYVTKQKKVWYNCAHEKYDVETDDYTLDSNYDFYSDFNTALTNWRDSDDYTEKFQACNLADSKSRKLYNAIIEYKSEDDKTKEIKDIVSDIHENILNMEKYEKSYGYNYDDYDEKMNEFLSSISDLQTKFELKLNTK